LPSANRHRNKTSLLSASFLTQNGGILGFLTRFMINARSRLDGNDVNVFHCVCFFKSFIVTLQSLIIIFVEHNTIWVINSQKRNPGIHSHKISSLLK